MASNLTLRQRIVLGYLIPMVLLAGVSGAVYWGVQELRQLSDALETSHVTVRNIQAVQLRLAQAITAAREYLLFGNEISHNNFRDAVAEFRDRFHLVSGQVTDPAQFDQLGRIGSASERLLVFTQQQVDLQAAGRRQEVIERFRSGESLALVRELNDLITVFEKREAGLVGQRKAQRDQAVARLGVTAAGGIGLAVILAVALGLWVGERVSAVVGEAIAGISATAAQISATVTEHERTAAQQAAAANETSATIDELSTSAESSSQQAASAAAAAEEAGQTAVQGTETIRQAVAAMAGLKGRIGTMAEQTLHLGEQTARIGGIAILVKDLSAEINMLALNAAVEAARAGEHGKGFAVVASEVRKLAVESKKSAEQVAALVADIQKTTNSAIMMTDEGGRTVEEVTRMAGEVGELFDEVAAMTVTANENAQQVVLSAKQQAAAYAQVVEAVASIAAGTRETATGIGQTKVGVQGLNEAAENLNRLI